MTKFEITMKELKKLSREELELFAFGRVLVCSALLADIPLGRMIEMVNLPEEADDIIGRVSAELGSKIEEILVRTN